MASNAFATPEEVAPCVCFSSGCGIGSPAGRARTRRYGSRFHPTSSIGEPVTGSWDNHGVLCAVEGCVREAKARSYCPMHYNRWKRHGDPGAAEPKYVISGSTVMRTCRRCGTAALALSFPRLKGTRRSVFCAECLRFRTKTSSHGHARDQAQRAKNIRRYGLTLGGLETLLLFQGERCAICYTSEPGGYGSFHIDHDHATRKVRGLLCGRCNVGIGMFREDPALMAAASAYLDGVQLLA